MATSDAEGGNTAAPTPTQQGQAQTPQIDKRLEPLEEFRSRAEGWMKEVTAQVARLASSFEHEDKKRQALEERLSDIEERIRSLLTLTELVSLDKNPFAGGPSTPVDEDAGSKTQTGPERTSAPSSSHASASTPGPSPAADPPQEKDPSPSTEELEEDERPEVQGHVPAADRPGVEVIPVSAEPPVSRGEETDPRETEEGGRLHTGPETDPDHKHETATERGSMIEAGAPEPVDPADEGPSDPFEEAGWAVPAPERHPPAGPTPGHHPNDAQAEPDPPAPASPTRKPPTGPVPGKETSSRLLVVAWADLLAPSAESIDVQRFTGFYVEAEWVDEKTARLVNRLVDEIAPHVETAGRTDVRGLHEATVRLLAEHDPDLPTFDRVDDAASEEPEGEMARLNAT